MNGHLQMNKKFLVIGLGAIGQIFSCHLKAAGYKVYGVDVNRDCVEKIRQNGIKIEGVTSVQADMDEVETQLSDFNAHDFDYVVICVKVPYMDDVIATLKKFKNNFQIVSMQNGIDNEEYLAKCFAREKVMRIVINFAGVLITPGHINMTFFHKPNYVGCLCSKENCSHAKELADIMTAAKLDTEPTNEIQKLTWKKTMLVASLAPISALLGMTMLEVMTMNETRYLVQMLLEESIEVARAKNFDFGDDYFTYCLDYLKKGGPHKPSMLIDLELGNPTEIDFINAKIAHHGHELDIPVHLNTYLTLLVKAKEKLEMKKRKEQ